MFQIDAHIAKNSSHSLYEQGNKKEGQKARSVLSDSENDSDDDVGNDGELEIPLDELET